MFFKVRIAFIFMAAVIQINAASAGPYNKPIYDPDTKSYFELYNPAVKTPGADRAQSKPYNRMVWERAMLFAASRKFKGVHGRLAVVDTAKTHEFLAEHFELGEPAWIGLRYWCSYKRLQWSTGEVHPFTHFQHWGSVWNIDGDSSGATKRASDCQKPGRNNFYPVHYWPTDEGFYWNANASSRGFASMFIEYQTGKP